MFKVDPKRVCRRAEIVQVIRTVTLVGSGTEIDPSREVVQYWTLDGKPIAILDPSTKPENSGSSAFEKLSGIVHF